LTSPDSKAQQPPAPSALNGDGQHESLLYRALVLFDRKRHATHRLQPVRDWSIARELSAVMLTAAEFPIASREFAIAFVPTGRDAANQVQVTPVALLGLRERENLFVRPDGGWDARYLPAFLRRYPFAYLRTGEEQLSLAVDESWSGFGAVEGEALLDAEGQPSELLRAQMSLLDHFEQSVARTRVLGQKLVELDLLRGGSIQGQLANGTPVKAEGFFMVDEEKLRALPDAAVLELHRNGLLGVIHAHLLSMGQVETLAERMAQRH
jgi:hypothetical protein